ALTLPSTMAAEQEVQDFFACHLTQPSGERSSGSDAQLDKDRPRKFQKPAQKGSQGKGNQWGSQWSGWNSQKRGRSAWAED
ncbi:unnamed protein product, partial [Symbiodinium sp. CCMP2456]